MLAGVDMEAQPLVETEAGALAMGEFAWLDTATVATLVTVPQVSAVVGEVTVTVLDAPLARSP